MAIERRYALIGHVHPFDGSLVVQSAAQTIGSPNVLTQLNMGTIEVPDGVRRVRVRAQVAWEDDPTTGYRLATIRKNGSDSYEGFAKEQTEVGRFQNLATAAIEVEAGDEFEVAVAHAVVGGLDVTAAWMELEVIE